MISIYGKNFHVYKDVDCETNSICSVQSSQVINSEMLICRMSCMEAGDMPLFIRISPSSRLGPLFISVILLQTITNVLPPSISQFNQTFSVFFDRPFFLSNMNLWFVPLVELPLKVKLWVMKLCAVGNLFVLEVSM